jgi:hypothetical protein
MEELVHSHKPYPVGYHFSHPHPSIFSEGPPPGQFRMPPLAQNSPPTRRAMVPAFPLKGRSLSQDSPRTRERVRVGHSRRWLGSPPRHDAAFFPHQTNNIPRLSVQPLDGHSRFCGSQSHTSSVPRVLNVNIESGSGMPDFPSLPIFSNPANMRVFRYHSNTIWSPSFSHFVFPHLVSFELTAMPVHNLLASQLLDFLGASPTLRTVDVKIIAGISFEDVPPGRVVVLPNVENFRLTFSEDASGYATATHISCPSARYTSITYAHDVIEGDVTPEEIFPYAQWWK